MKISKVTLAAAALVAASAPIAGQAIAADRVAAPIGADSELGGGASIAVVFLLAVFAVAIFAGDGDDEPASP